MTLQSHRHQPGYSDETAPGGGIGQERSVSLEVWLSVFGPVKTVLTGIWETPVFLLNIFAPV